MGYVLLFLLLYFYFLPFIYAVKYLPDYKWRVFWIGLLLNWTGIVWVGLLVWERLWYLKLVRDYGTKLRAHEQAIVDATAEYTRYLQPLNPKLIDGELMVGNLTLDEHIAAQWKAHQRFIDSLEGHP